VLPGAVIGLPFAVVPGAVLATVGVLGSALGVTGLGLNSEGGVGLEGQRRVVSRA